MDRGDRVRGHAAWVVAGTGMAACLITVPVHHWLAHHIELTPLYWNDLVLGTVWPLLGAVVARSQPRNPLCWVMLLPALMGPYYLLSYYAAYSFHLADDPLPGWRAAAWVGCWGFVGYWFATPLVPLLFPNGRAATRSRTLCVRAVITIASLGTIAAMLRPSGTDPAPSVPNPLALDGATWLHGIMLGSAATTMLGGTLVAVVLLVLRVRTATGTERAQLQWFMLGGLVMTICFAGSQLGPGDSPVVEDSLLCLGLLGPPAAIALAILRHRLLDVEFVLNRALVLTLLSGVVLLVYGLVVAGVGVLAAGSTAGTVAVAAAALIAASGRGAVQSAVDRMLFGHRKDPYAVVAKVSRHIAPASEPAEALQCLVEALRPALRLPYVCFDGSGIHTSSGTPVPDAGWRTIPCLALGQQVGELHIGRHRPGEAWTPQQQGAVREVADRAGTLAYAASLVGDITRSRALILSIREEERRRIRADLHDGVAPALAGTAHQLDGLARRLHDPELAQLINILRDRLRTVVKDLRTVVQGLRPAVLDQLGLPKALRELLAGYDTPVCHAEVDPACAELPAAVEVAAYAIAAEAIGNAIRHSAAARIELTAAVRDGQLVLTVRDNGRGIPKRHRTGLGLRSMRERATETGGRLEVLTDRDGTLIRARLPVEATP